MLLSIIKIYNPYAGLSNSHRRNIVKASFCLSARSARVKEAQVESCEYTKTKWVERFWLLLASSGFAYGWSEANPDSEQNEPT